MDNKAVFSHSEIVIKNREYTTISGVEQLLSFDDTCISLVLCGAGATLEGEGLLISRLSLDDGVVEVSGRVFGLNFNDNEPKRNGFSLGFLRGRG